MQTKRNISYDWQNNTVLIAEDADMNFLLLKSFLLKTKINIIWANNGKIAVDIFLENNNIDLILMDMQMPILNGYEATKKIKEIDSKIPIIAQTAFAMSGEKEKILDIGCDDYVSKPINRIELLKKMDYYINRKINHNI